MLLKKLLCLVIASLLSINLTVAARTRGERTSDRSLRVRGSREKILQHQYHRRDKWGGVAKKKEEATSDLELDDPEEALYREGITNTAIPKASKNSNDATISPKATKASSKSTAVEELEETLHHKGTAAPKMDSKGTTEGNTDNSEWDCDDPAAPCAIPEAPSLSPTEYQTYSPSPEQTKATLEEAVLNTMEREITPFKISYTLDRHLYSGDLDDGDYVELKDNTVLHLTQYFLSYFEDEPVVFQEILVSLQKTADDLVVRFYVSTFFEIPGNVPTMTNLFDRMSEAFSDENAIDYINILALMGEGNPFKNTISVSLVNDTPTSAETPQAESTDNSRNSRNSKSRLLLYLLCGASLILVILAYSWIHQAVRGKKDSEHQQLAPDPADQANDKNKGIASKRMVKPFGTPSDAQRYINSIRRRYSSDEGSATDLEDISLDPEDRFAEVPVRDNRKVMEELRTAMRTLENLSQSRSDKIQNGTSSNPVISNVNGNEDNNETKPFDEGPEGFSIAEKNDSQYLEYLDMDSTGSFDGEDLRN